MVLDSFVHDGHRDRNDRNDRKYIIMEWTIEMKMILIKNDKSYIDKNINGNKYSNEIKINNVNDIRKK